MFQAAFHFFIGGPDRIDSDWHSTGHARQGTEQGWAVCGAANETIAMRKKHSQMPTATPAKIEKFNPTKKMVNSFCICLGVTLYNIKHVNNTCKFLNWYCTFIRCLLYSVYIYTYDIYIHINISYYIYIRYIIYIYISYYLFNLGISAG